MKNFALIGAAGYIAPRHLQAIRATGNRLIAAVDPHDSVGILDQTFPDARFFTEIERFDRFLELLRRKSEQDRVHVVTVCSPNYLHDAHVRLGLRVHADVICEKPLVISPWNLDQLQDLEREYGGRVFTVLQMRLHPVLIAQKEKLPSRTAKQRSRVQVTYVTRRGPWYQTSWKGIPEKSGGLAMNIGIHFFDLLLWLFGPVERAEAHLNTPEKVAGALELRGADVTWFLSIDAADLPKEPASAGRAAYRSFLVDGEEIDFSQGFTDLHARVYEEALQGRGFGVEDARASIELVHRLRSLPVGAAWGDRHPLLAGAGARP